MEGKEKQEQARKEERACRRDERRRERMFKSSVGNRMEGAKSAYLGVKIRKSIESYMKRLSDEYGIKHPELHVLFVLDYSGVDTATDVVNEMGVSRAFVSKAVDSLVKHGFVETEQDKDDRRIVHIRKTEEADKLLQEVENARGYLVEALLKGVSDEELKMFNATMKKIVKNAEEII